MGRHARISEIEERKQVRLLASAGLTSSEIASKLGVTQRTLFNRLGTDRALKAAYDEGRVIARSRKQRELTGGRRPGDISRVRIDPATIRELAKEGATLPKIARILDTSTLTLKKRLNETPELQKEYDLGRGELLDIVGSALVRNAKAGDPASARLLLERLFPMPGENDPFQRLLKRKGYI